MKKLLLLLLLTLSYNVYGQEHEHKIITNYGFQNKTYISFRIILPDSTILTGAVANICIKDLMFKQMYIGDTVKVIYTSREWDINSSYYDEKNDIMYEYPINVFHGTWIIKEIKNGEFVFR